MGLGIRDYDSGRATRTADYTWMSPSTPPRSKEFSPPKEPPRPKESRQKSESDSGLQTDVAGGEIALAWLFLGSHARTNVAHTRQSRPDSGLGLQVKVLKPYFAVPSSRGSGPPSLFSSRYARCVVQTCQLWMCGTNLLTLERENGRGRARASA